MASDSGSGNGALYFIVGGLVVVVGVIAFFVFGQPGFKSNNGPSIKIELPKAPAKTQ